MSLQKDSIFSHNLCFCNTTNRKLILLEHDRYKIAININLLLSYLLFETYKEMEILFIYYFLFTGAENLYHKKLLNHKKEK